MSPNLNGVQTPLFKFAVQQPLKKQPLFKANEFLWTIHAMTKAKHRSKPILNHILPSFQQLFSILTNKVSTIILLRKKKPFLFSYEN